MPVQRADKAVDQKFGCCRCAAARLPAARYVAKARSHASSCESRATGI